MKTNDQTPHRLPMLALMILAVAMLIAGAVVSHAEAAGLHDKTAVIEAVQKEFEDVPAMVEIARCESKFRQFTDSGNVFYGGYGNQMIGIFQFYESVHSGTASRLGHDLGTIEGNIAYARYLYEMEGLSPWNSSKSCWEHALSTHVAKTQVEVLSAKPTREELEAQLEKLQKIVALLTTLLELKASGLS